MSTDRARTRRSRLFVVGALAAVALLAAACGDDTKDTAKDASPTTAAEVTTTAPAMDHSTTTESATPASGTIKIDAVDYGYEGVPAKIAAGSKIALHNTSAKEVHEMVVMKLPESETRSGAELTKLPMAELQQLLAGPPALVMVAPPSTDGFAAVGDGTLSEPGRYLAICAVPTGANPQAYMSAAAQAKGGPVSVPGGPPHFVQGMWAEFTVV